MNAHSTAPIHLHDRVGSSSLDDQQTLFAVVDQLNVVTERLHALETKIANGTLIINEAPQTTPATPLRAVRTTSTSGWQPAG